MEAARILSVDRLSLGLQDRLLSDTTQTRLQVAQLIREHRSRWVYGTGEACVHPDHAAAVGLTRAAVFLARLGQWERVPGGELFLSSLPWTTVGQRARLVNHQCIHFRQGLQGQPTLNSPIGSSPIPRNLIDTTKRDPSVRKQAPIVIVL